MLVVESKKIVLNSSSMAESTMCRFFTHLINIVRGKGGGGNRLIKLLIILDVSLVFARIVGLILLYAI
jgi:hypothetical protein